jgi:hypothetical protein
VTLPESELDELEEFIEEALKILFGRIVGLQ